MFLILILNMETQTEFPKPDRFSLVTLKTQTDGKLTTDAKMQTDWVYTTVRNGTTAHKCINIDMIKLLNDNTTIQVFHVVSYLQNYDQIKKQSKPSRTELKLSNYHRRCAEFQNNNQNQSSSYKNCLNKHKI